MAIVFLTPSQVADQYLTYLKGLKPEVNTNQQDSDWWIRSRVVGGLVAGAYADQRRIADDAFPQLARRDALERHLDLYFGAGFKDATISIGEVGVTGQIGTVYTPGTEFLYQPNGNVYQATGTTTITTVIAPNTASGVLAVQSISTGQNQNLLAGAPLLVSSPPPGSFANAIAFTNMSDGRDIETDEEASARILSRVRFPPAGGTFHDYFNWAINADPSVVDANIIRFIYGPGTVGIVIVAGTTDIDTALNTGQAIVRLPSDALVARVQAYIDALRPLTDCAYVLKPVLVNIDVTIRVRFLDGDLNTVPTTQLAGQTLTQQQLVVREVQRAIYKTPPGGRQFGASGFMVASEIEEQVDQSLSDEPYFTGLISPILIDRDVDDLSASGPNRRMLNNELAQPGTINVIVMT